MKLESVLQPVNSETVLLNKIAATFKLTFPAQKFRDAFSTAVWSNHKITAIKIENEVKCCIRLIILLRSIKKLSHGDFLFFSKLFDEKKIFLDLILNFANTEIRLESNSSTRQKAFWGGRP